MPDRITLVDRSFELPGAVHVLNIGAYLGFLAIMTTTFGNTELAIPMVICLYYVVMAFGVPSMWTQIGGAQGKRRLSWRKFSQSEFNTNTCTVAA